MSVHTGIINTNGKTTYETEIMNLTVSNSAWSGARINMSTRVCWGVTYNVDTLQLGYGSNYSNLYVGYYKNKWIGISQKVVENYVVTYVENDVITQMKEPIQKFVTNAPIYLFTINNNGTPFAQFMAVIRMKYYKVYKEGIFVWNSIPCLDKNNKPCMFDTVTRQPFYNQGTGEFGYELLDRTYVAPI